MTVTVSSFRQQFPAFQNEDIYPNPVVQMFIGVYTKLVNADRWGDLTDFGIGLAVAHNLALEGQAYKAQAVGGVPGGGVGVANNKSVDKASVGYDTTVATEEGAGFWNLTTYGTRYYRYALLFGAGPLQVGTSPADTGVSSSAQGTWFGPPIGYPF